jgi:hypothetical protein
MPAVNRGAEFENIVAEVFRKAGWRTRRHPVSGDSHVDLLVDNGEWKYAVEVKSASEGRRDRLIPLLAQAILEAQGFADRHQEGVRPLAVVAARRIPSAVANAVRHYAERHAPGVALGIVDAEGLRSFVGDGLSGFSGEPTYPLPRPMAQVGSRRNLFSGLNQWMLKILLGQCLPEAMISVPRAPIPNASRLAALAGVSVMSATRFVSQLSIEGFLGDHPKELRVVRADELLEQWASASRKMSQDVPVHSIIKRDKHQLLASIARYLEEARVRFRPASKGSRIRLEQQKPRVCVGLFEAADALGLGFVHGAPMHLYLESLDLKTLRTLGLSGEGSDRAPHIYVRIPLHKEAVFRPAVLRDKMPVSDVLQVWLDAWVYPARGREQADVIMRRILKPMIGKHS